MSRIQLTLFSIALLIIAGFLTNHYRDLMSDYGTGFSDELFRNGELRKTINKVYAWRQITGIGGIIGLVCAFLEIGVSRSKNKE